MQRQSLGSPASKHLLLSIKDTSFSSSSSSSISPLLASPSSSPQHQPDKKLVYRKPPQRFIHVIPLLAILCFLILYLSSHHPSQLEMDHFKGFKTMPNPTDSIDEMDKLFDVKEADILSMRSLRNLQELDGGGATSNYQQLHRKIGGW